MFAVVLTGGLVEEAVVGLSQEEVGSGHFFLVATISEFKEVQVHSGILGCQHKTLDRL